MSRFVGANSRRGWTIALAAAGALLLACGPGRAQPPGAGDVKTVRGTVERMTTAPRGEVDGAVLDDGTWLHWPPHMQDRFADVVKKGDRVRATGRTETGPAGDTHFEVERVTNLSSDAAAENPDFANGPPPRGPRGRGPGRVADRDRRIRDLQEQLDQLQRELDRLRRER